MAGRPHWLWMTCARHHRWLSPGLPQALCDRLNSRHEVMCVSLNFVPSATLSLVALTEERNPFDLVFSFLSCGVRLCCRDMKFS